MASSIFSALLAIVIGAVGAAIYATLSHFIPLMILGMLLPLGVAWAIIFFAYGSLKGVMLFRLLISIVGAVVNAGVIWFAFMAFHLDFDSAVYVFSNGPFAVYDTVLLFSEEFSYEINGGAVTGSMLLVFWGVEQAILITAIVFALFASSDNQHMSHGESLANAGDVMTSQVAPAAGIVVLSVLKGAIQLAVVVGLLALAGYFFGF